jgi:hypothetical protein
LFKWQVMDEKSAQKKSVHPGNDKFTVKTGCQKCSYPFMSGISKQKKYTDIDKMQIILFVRF